MPALAGNRYHVAAAAGQRLRQSLFGVEGFAALVQDHRRQIGAELDLAGVGRQGTGQHVEQCRLPGAIRADDPDPVAAQDLRREIPHDRAARIGF